MFQQTDEEIYEKYRLSSRVILELIELLKPQLESPTLRSCSIPTHVQVLCSLHLLASGSYQGVIAAAGGVSPSALSRFFRSFLDAILSHMSDYIYLPRNAEEINTTKLGFYRIANFPHVLGCVDGTHVPICPPSRLEYVFRNRKSTHFLIIQVVCDAHNVITDIVAKYPGSTHDAYIFRHSGIQQRLERGEFDEGYLLDGLLVPELRETASTAWRALRVLPTCLIHCCLPASSTTALPFYDNAHALHLLRGINELRAEQKFFDMTIAVDGQDFPCHRTVLAAASNYFRAMFAGCLRESHAERVELHDVSAGTLGLLVDFCYTGRVTVTQENVELLLQAADLFQFPSVKEACCAYLEQQLDVANCLEIQDFAEAYACRGLAESTKRFILAHIVELTQVKEFERLPKKRILEYVRDDRLCVDKEETAYQIALRWVKADPKRRQHFWPELFEHVRLPFIRRFYLLAHVESDPIVYYCPPCLKLIAEARAFQSCEYDRHDYPCERMRPRPSTGLAEILVVIGGCDQDCDELVTVDCYNTHTGQWRYLAEFPDHLGGGYSIAALGNDIYVTGGSDGSRLYEYVWRYNSSVNEWTEVSPMLKPREYHSSTVLKGLLYVIASDSTERYDPTLDAWEALKPMLYPMDNCSTTSCHGKLYAIGSLEGEEAMVIQCYDPEINTWSLVNCGQLPPWSFAPKTVTLNGLIYFVRDDSAEVDVYNPRKNEWGKIPPMKQVHVGGSVAALGGKMYVSGGYDNTFELSDVVEAFDPDTRTWDIVGRLPQPSFWHGSVSIFRQFMPLAPCGFGGVTLDNVNNERNSIQLSRQHQNFRNQNLNELR